MAPSMDIARFVNPAVTESTDELAERFRTARPFRPSLLVDISSELEAKLDAIRAYKSVLRPPPDVRSPENIRHLAFLRGCELGVEYAEAFQILRWVI